MLTRTLNLFLLLVILGTATSAHAIPQMFSYQGVLVDGGGSPVTTTTTVLFAIWTAPAGGDSLWSESQSITPDASGSFVALLGSNNPIPDSAIAGNAYLSMKVETDPEMAPRTMLVSVAYAYRAGTVDEATGGHITSKVNIGTGNSNPGTQAFVAGENNTADGNYATVSGGLENQSLDSATSIGGGHKNRTIGVAATVAGGDSNSVAANFGTIAGGRGSTVLGHYGFIGGGIGNRAEAQAPFSGILAGDSNQTQGEYSSILGGHDNVAIGDYSAITGGATNTNWGAYATIAGGEGNLNNGGTHSFIAGGLDNEATGDYAVAAGGRLNEALGFNSFAAGLNCLAHGDYSVAMGSNNLANATNAWAIGKDAEALHTGSFVWHSYGGFPGTVSTTAPQQFLIWAQGGVGIRTNTPFTALTLRGTMSFEEQALDPMTPMMYMYKDDASNNERPIISHSSAFPNWGLTYKDVGDRMIFQGGGTPALSIELGNRNVGIRVEDPTNILEVVQSSTTDPIADAWTTYSSRRWKTNIATLQGAVDIVKRLRGVEYDWKETGEHDIGLVAEEVGEVLPEVVDYEDNGIDARSVDYARLVAVLIEAVKEQQASLAGQADRISALERELADLRAEGSVDGGGARTWVKR